MDAQLAAIFALTLVINLILSLAYAARIAGVRTRRVAVSASLFNALALLSRTANMLQGPLLAKRLERAVGSGGSVLLGDYRWLVGGASLGALLGALMVPSVQRVFTRAVAAFSVQRSLARLLVRVPTPAGIGALRDSFALPKLSSLTTLGRLERPPLSVLLSNLVGTAAMTVGVLSANYAGVLQPSMRLTAGSLSAIVNGFSTVLMFVVVDPYLSLATDDVVEGRAGEGSMRRSVIWFLGTRLAGTVLAQALLVPGALAIAAVAERL